MSNKKNWWKFYIEINKDIEELIMWKLNQLDISTYAFNYPNSGNQLGQLIIWLPLCFAEKNVRDQLEGYFRKLLFDNNMSTNLFGWDLIKEEDWLNSWKSFWDLEFIGNNFLVLPSWKDLPPKYDHKVIIKINPGISFGTGGHPSTSLCLEIMEKTDIKEKRTLDVGCGTGILSIAAKKLGAKELHAIDNDNLAINSTRENIALNFTNLNSFTLHQDSFEEIQKKIHNNYDLIFCNMIASVIKKFLPRFYQILNWKGSLILSGILNYQKEEIIKLLNLYHFKIDNVSSKKDWICIKSFK